MSNRSSFVLTSEEKEEISVAVALIKEEDKEEAKIEILEDGAAGKNIEINPIPINAHYSFPEEQLLAEQFYKSPALNYETIFYGPAREQFPAFGPEKMYSADDFREEESELLTTEEAEETFEKIQYSSMLGTASDVSAEERRKFDWWIKFNPSYFAVFLANSLTRDVNYGSL